MERLLLIKASLLQLEDLLLAFEGCDAVFHLASPMTDDPVS
jgi:cinnamoyl-CoA reductase